MFDEIDKEVRSGGEADQRGERRRERGEDER